MWDLEWPSLLSLRWYWLLKSLCVFVSVCVIFRVSYPALASRHATPRHATPRHATPRHATPGRLPRINALQLCKLHTTATCYLLVEICLVVQFGTGWQAAICKLYILCLCEWHHVYGVTSSLWAQTWCHGVTAGLFNHIKRTWNTCLESLCFSFTPFFVGLYFAASHLSPLSFGSRPFPPLFPPSLLLSWGEGEI